MSEQNMQISEDIREAVQKAINDCGHFFAQDGELVFHQRVVGNFSRPAEVFGARNLVREKQCDQILRIRLLPLRGCFAARIAP